MNRVKIVLSGWADVIETTFGRTLSSHGICQSVASANILCMSTLYCSPVLRHPAGLIQAANFRSAIAF
jgi:hypothetical protein